MYRCYVIISKFDDHSHYVITSMCVNITVVVFFFFNIPSAFKDWRTKLCFMFVGKSAFSLL